MTALATDEAVPPQALVHGPEGVEGAERPEGAEGEGRRRRRRGGRGRGEGRPEGAGPIDGADTEAPPLEAGDTQPGEDTGTAVAPEVAGDETPREGGRGRRRGRGRREPREDGAEGLVEAGDTQPALIDDAAEAAPAPVSAETAAPVVVAEAPVAPVAAPAPAAPALPKVPDFVLPLADLQALATAAGLEWVGSDAHKVAVAQAAIAATPKPVHVPREPRPPVVLDEGPLVLVETKKDLSQLKLPFEQQQPQA